MELYHNLPLDLKKEIDKYLPTRKQLYYKTHKHKILKQHRRYRLEHKEEERERARKYNQLHREQIEAKRQVKTQCICGGSYCYRHRAPHYRTKLHQNWLS